MCGIIGYLGEKEASEVIIDGLEKLEYRGYDSSGIAINGGDSLQIKKFKGRLSVLEDELKKDPIKGHLGIGHTRWATHGAPSDENAHPHFNDDKTFAVVHNGIIENYMTLKNELEKDGIKFKSQTDTEVVVYLIEKYYSGDLLDAVFKAVSRLKGAYALAVISSKHNHELIAVRKDSPLVAGVTGTDVIVASDVPALLKYTKDVYYLDNGEILYANANKLTIYDEYKNVVDKKKEHILWDMEAAEKGGYDYFMEKEINEQPEAIRLTIEHRLDENGDIDLGFKNITPEFIVNINKICIVGCGTAYNAGVVGKAAMQKLFGKYVVCDIASEFRYNDNHIDDKTLVILMSQSGETADTLAVLRNCKEQKAKILAITNVVGSSIAREADDVIYTWAGPEVAVASTKAYTTQIVALYLVALDFALKLYTINKEYYHKIISKMLALPEKIQYILDHKENIHDVAAFISKKQHAFYLGRTIDYSLAQEGSLKLKEISYIHAEAFAAGELKHGTIALIEKDTPVIAIMTQDVMLTKMISNIEEVRARGAKVFSVTQASNKQVEKVSEKVLYIPDSDNLLAPILSIIPLQILALEVAKDKGLNVDKPRNLAKSVTVE